MKIAISSLPKKPWWSDGIIGYKDNPFMKNGTIPNQNLLIKERLNLIATLRKNKVEVIEFQFPKILEESKFGHDYVFIRDSFISDLNGNVLMLKFAEKKREAETEIVANELEKLNFNLKELPTEKNILAEGGEFYFCPKDKLLFSGINRNTIAGAEYVASFLNANELILIDTPSFHLDTVFTTVFDKQGTLSAMIVCEELITKDSFKNLEKISVELNVHIITIPAKDSIGTDNQLGSLAVNSFCAPGLLISSSNYSDFSVEQKLDSLGVNTEVCPVSQFQLSGGSVHCLTNEL
jgi:N-dimethylarginine dimethylaminohydrolase